MKLEEVVTRDNEFGFDRDISIKLKLVDGEGVEVNSLEFSEGEPEDNTLDRNMSGAYKVAELVKYAYQLGKEGKELEFTYKEIKEEE